MKRYLELAAAAVLITALTTVHSYGRSEGGKPAKSTKTDKLASVWEATGTLFEACSCSVPCPCNFRQSPSQGYCHTIYAYKLKTARYEKIKLDGLVFGGGEGDKEPMGYLDSRATADQKVALKKLALAIFSKGGPSPGNRQFDAARIIAESNSNTFTITFGDAGGFAAKVLMGGDGKNPIVVENNVTWPVKRFTKGQTTKFDYKDKLGNVLQFDGVNANLGEFDLKQ